jgi:hypothetical protein
MQSIFHGKNGPNLPSFEKKNKFKSPDFYNKFQSVGKNIEGSWFFSTFIFGM